MEKTGTDLFFRTNDRWKINLSRFLGQVCKSPMAELHYRESILSYFESMAVPENQEQVGPTEAFCLWFDDLYVPCDDPSIYNPDVYEKGLKEFESCFSKEELEAMARYHRYFASISNEFNIDREWSEIQRDPQWQRLTDEARNALMVFQRATHI